MNLSNYKISQSAFTYFQQLIFDVAGITISDAKKALVVSRLTRRLRIHHLDSFDHYVRELKKGLLKTEQQHIIDLLTTNETYFFREEKHFTYLVNYLKNRSDHNMIRIWSAASSTGEEAYSIAMVLVTYWRSDWEIIASDINQNVLHIAQQGHYSMSAAQRIPKEYLQKYCLKGINSQSGTFLLRPEIKRKVHFRQINLNQVLPNDIGIFDIIFLRNTLIYFDLPIKSRIVKQLVAKLKTGGIFIIGHSESLNHIQHTLTLQQATIYKKK